MTTKNQRQILSPINPAKKLAKSTLPTVSQSVALKSPIDSRKCLANQGVSVNNPIMISLTNKVNKGRPTPDLLRYDSSVDDLGEDDEQFSPSKEQKHDI